MWDDLALQDHLEAGQYEHIYFDQCCTREHPCVQKTTQLSATRQLAAALRPRFVALRCQLPASQHKQVQGGPSADGRFASEALSRYSSRMNQLIAEAIVECIQSGTSDPGGAMPTRAPLGRAPPVNRAVAEPSLWPTVSCGSSMTQGTRSSSTRQTISWGATSRAGSFALVHQHLHEGVRAAAGI
jgi:hypothetical protein